VIIAWDPRGIRIVTAVIAQVLRDVYAALVLGCKMEIPVGITGLSALRELS
jgi:hypothetical protein